VQKILGPAELPGTVLRVAHLFHLMNDDQRAELWLKRAAEIRAEALQMPSTDHRTNLLKLAADWEHMGLKARERARGEGEDESSRESPASQGWEQIPSQNRGPDSPRHH
jgi:hypothetical protein